MRTIKTVKGDARLRRRAKYAAETLRQERGTTGLKSEARVVITKDSTATGRGEIAFRASRVLSKSSRRGHG